MKKHLLNFLIGAFALSFAGVATGCKPCKTAELKIIAVIVAKDAHKVEIDQALRSLVEATRKEKGNVSYVLHQDTKNPLKYTIVEEWESQAAIDFHNKTEHFLSFVKNIEGKTDGVTIDIIREIY